MTGLLLERLGAQEDATLDYLWAYRQSGVKISRSSLLLRRMAATAEQRAPYRQLPAVENDASVLFLDWQVLPIS